jgi:acyl carrier protein
VIQSVTQAEAIDETRRYITENFLYGIVDSMGMMELIGFLEDRFGLQPADDEITEQNFATLRRIAAFVASKRAAASSAA